MTGTRRAALAVELSELRAQLEAVERELAEARVAPVWARGPARSTARLECRRELFAALVRRRERELGQQSYPQAGDRPVDNRELAS